MGERKLSKSETNFNKFERGQVQIQRVNDTFHFSVFNLSSQWLPLWAEFSYEGWIDWFHLPHSLPLKMLCMDCQLGITTDRHCSKQADVPMKSLMDKLWAWSMETGLSCELQILTVTVQHSTCWNSPQNLLNWLDLNSGCVSESNTKSDALWSSHGALGYNGGKDCLIWIVHTNLTGLEREVYLKISQDFNILSGYKNGVFFSCSSPPMRSRL